jgi:hypothetical protein
MQQARNPTTGSRVYRGGEAEVAEEEEEAAAAAEEEEAAAVARRCRTSIKPL